MTEEELPGVAVGALLLLSGSAEKGNAITVIRFVFVSVGVYAALRPVRGDTHISSRHRPFYRGNVSLFSRIFFLHCFIELSSILLGLCGISLLRIIKVYSILFDFAGLH